MDFFCARNGSETGDNQRVSFQCTKRGKIISINRLINCFDDNDVEKAKSLLFNKLLEKKKNCESDFVQLLYLTMSQHLNFQDVNELYKEIENIFDEKSARTNIQRKDYNKKLLQHDRNTNILFYQLPTDTIDVLSRFLNERDSIIFGCTNRFLYYKTQCNSFMINCNNQTGLYRNRFELNMKRIEKKLCANSIETETRCRKIGSFEAMRAFSTSCNNIFSDIHFDNDYKYNETMFNTLPENMNKIINGKIDDLKEDDVHGILVHKIRELESTYPHRIASKISILESLPIEIKEELQSLPRIKLFEMIKNDEKYKSIDDMKQKPESEICENILQQIQTIYQCVKNWDDRTIPDIHYLPNDVSLENTVNGINTPRNRYFVAVQKALVSATRKFVLYFIESEKLRKELYWTYGELLGKEDIERIKEDQDQENLEKKENDKKIENVDKEKLLLELEKRYQKLFGLYYMKSSEVENLTDRLLVCQERSQEDADRIGELESQIKNLMSSATQNVDIRMKCIVEKGQLTQTFAEMMRQLERKAQYCAAAARSLCNRVDTDLTAFLPEELSDDANRLLDEYVTNVKNPCQCIEKEFNIILEQFVGVKQFVHPDREMVETLQQQVQQLRQQIDVKEKEKETENQTTSSDRTNENE